MAIVDGIAVCDSCQRSIAAGKAIEKDGWMLCPDCGLSRLPPPDKPPESASHVGLYMLIGAAIIGFVAALLAPSRSIGIGGYVLMGAALAIAIAGIPGAVAQKKRRHRDIRAMGYLGMILPPLWLVALIWAIVAEPE